MRPFYRSAAWRRFVEERVPEAVNDHPSEQFAKEHARRNAFIGSLKARNRHTLVLAGSNGLLGKALEIALGAEGHLVRFICQFLPSGNFVGLSAECFGFNLAISICPVTCCANKIHRAELLNFFVSSGSSDNFDF